MIPPIGTSLLDSSFFPSIPCLIAQLSTNTPENAILEAINAIPPSEQNKLILELTKTTILGKKTALHLAIINGYEKLTDILIEYLKESPKYLAVADSFGDTPLHIAIRLDKLDIAYKLIKALKGYPLLLLTKNLIAEVSSLYLAIDLGKLEFATHFVLQIDSKLGPDTEPLKLCITRGFWDLAQLLLERHTVDEIANTELLLHLSLKYPKKEISAQIIEKLSKTPKRLIEPDEITEKTPLQAALSHGFVDIANQIITTVAKTSPELLTFETATSIPSLHWMLNHNYQTLAQEYIKALKDHPEFLFKKDYLGDTPFLLAVKKGYLSIAKLLASTLKNNKKLLSTRDYLSHKPLCIAKENRDISMIQFIEEIERKAAAELDDTISGWISTTSE